jgi:hypothetical protein
MLMSATVMPKQGALWQQPGLIQDGLICIGVIVLVIVIIVIKIVIGYGRVEEIGRGKLFTVSGNDHLFTP